MLTADNETSGPEGPRNSCGVEQSVDGVSGAGAGQNLSVEEGRRKRKASVLSRDSNNVPGNGEGLEVECMDSLRISMEIETLRSQLDEDVKELGYCEENEKLRIEMDLKEKETQCLRKQIEGLETKYNKLDEELQAKYEKQHEELQAKFEKRNEELQVKYEKQNQKLEAMYEKKNEELESMHKKKKEDLEAKYEKQTEQLQAKHEGLQKNILENQIDAKRKQLCQLEGLYSSVEFALTQLEEKGIPDKSNDENSNSKLVDKSLAEKSVVDGKAADEELKWLEMEVARLDTKIRIKMEKLRDMVEPKRFTEKLGSARVQKHIHTNVELQKLKAGWRDQIKRQTGLGFKRIGELDEKPFLNVCKIRYGNDDYLTKGSELIKNWQEEIKNPTWHPFKAVKQADGVNKEVINDDDTKLKCLWNEFGNDVCDAVKTALMEINNPRALE
ncbi:hypothetical protein EJB05_31595, partial [Eragrostis curvula]